MILRNCFKLSTMYKPTAFPFGPRNIEITSRSLFSRAEGTDDDELLGTKWTPIYNLPVIRGFVGMHRLKIYQSFITAAGLPVCIWLEETKNLAVGSTLTFGLLGLTGTISLCIASYFATNIIGFIYFNAEKKLVRFSYIDFMGKRLNLNVPVSEILHPSEYPSMKLLGSIYVPIRTTKNAKPLKLLRYGNIYNKKVFETLFGT